MQLIPLYQTSIHIILEPERLDLELPLLRQDTKGILYLIITKGVRSYSMGSYITYKNYGPQPSSSGDFTCKSPAPIH